MLYLPVVPKMPGILGTTHGAIQFTPTVYLVILGVGQLLCGPISDRRGRRPVLLGGTALFIIASLAKAITVSTAIPVGARIVQAIGASAMPVATFATVRDALGDDPKASTTYYSLRSVITGVVGTLTIAFLGDDTGWPLAVYAIAMASVCAIAHAILQRRSFSQEAVEASAR